MNPLDEEEEIGRIEGTDIESYEERELNYHERLIIEASKTPFWFEVLMPELDNDIATLDGLLTTETDPWRRYALVEAYKVMSNFKLKLINALENSVPQTRE